MPRKIEVTLYKFSELPTEKAKEKARQWWRESSAGDNWFAEHVVEDFSDVLKACGFDVRMRRGTRTEYAIYWSTNPAEGAFDASWSASAVNVAQLIADRPLTYKDADGKEQQSKHNAELVPLLQRMAALAAKAPHSYGSVDTTRGCNINVTWESPEHCEDSHPADCDCYELEQEFEDIASSLAHYLGWNVQEEMEYQDGDEILDANEYEFDEDGNPAP